MLGSTLLLITLFGMQEHTASLVTSITRPLLYSKNMSKLFMDRELSSQERTSHSTWGVANLVLLPYVPRHGRHIV